MNIRAYAKNVAQSASKAILSPYYKKEENIRKYLNFLDFYRYNQTIGALAKKRHFYPKRNISDFFSNLDWMNKQQSVKYLKEIIKKDYKKNYPKTQNVREYIVNEDRISLSKIKSSKGYNYIDKLKIMLNIFKKGV